MEDSMKIGQQVRYSDRVDSVGTVTALGPDGSVRVTWREPARGEPRMRYWYDAVTAARFLKLNGR
jgi:hypothetical protein